MTWASVYDDKSHLRGNCPFNNMRFGGNLRNLEWIFSPYQKECGNFTSYELLYGGRIFWEDEYISVKESSTQQMCVCVNDLFLYTVLRYEPLQCVCVETLFFTRVFQALVLSWSRRVCVCFEAPVPSVFMGSWECRAQLVVMVQEWIHTSKWGRIIDFKL